MTAPETLEGWFAFHDLRQLDRAAWNALDPDDRHQIVAEAAGVLDSYERLEDSPEGCSVGYSVIGHKGDLLFLHLRPDPGQLFEIESAFDETRLAAYLTRPYSFFSVIEVSRHGAPEGTAGNIEDSPYVQSRLYPKLPDYSSYICFYPMSKKRDGADNWYSLTNDERGDLMRVHGRTGRKYAGKVAQIVTGSVGIDDWEWGVTLFSDEPLQFKKLVYEMRFDEVTARYGEFGQFYVGRRLVPADLGRYLNG